MIRYLTLSQIQAEVTRSVDFGDMSTTEDWLDMMVTKANDSGFGHLVDSIIDIGFDDREGVHIDDGCIWEGHHRLVAAILLCLDKVPVTDRYTRDYHGILAHDWHPDPHPIDLTA